MARDETAIVQLQVRLREDLRQALEQAARARHVSLNQEIVDRLDYARDRQGLLPDVLELAYGRPTAGILMLLGAVMEDAGNLCMRHAPTRSRQQRNRLHWTEDPVAYDVALRNAIAVLFALRPRESQKAQKADKALRTEAARQSAELIHAVRHGPGRLKDTRRRLPPAHDPAVIASLIWPLAKRLPERRHETERLVRGEPPAADGPPAEATTGNETHRREPAGDDPGRE